MAATLFLFVFFLYIAASFRRVPLANFSLRTAHELAGLIDLPP